MKTTESSFTGEKGVPIFYRVWEPEAGEAKAIVLLAHGYAEHAGRYQLLAEHLTGRGYIIYAPDHRGHGRSGGTKGLIDNIDYFLSDLNALHQRIQAEHPGMKIFVLGHSLGGQLALLHALEQQESVSGCVLSGVALKLGAGVSPVAKALAKTLAVVAPTIGLQELKSEWLSHDPAIVRSYDTDPLNYRGKVMARTGVELLRGANAALTKVGELRIPLLCMHGGADLLVDPDSSRYLTEHVSCEDKTLHIFDGLYHEIYNEHEKYYVYAQVTDWLDERCA